MNRNKLKTYAPKARRDFISAVTARAAQFGVTEKGVDPVSEQGDLVIIKGEAYPKKVGSQRKRLIARIERDGFKQTMETAAYTWFNRFAAIRYMNSALAGSEVSWAARTAAQCAIASSTRR